MRVLVACEFSGIVREAFRKKGHLAYSCDLLPTEIPGRHHQGDVRDIINMGWDLMIAHPPCTYLASSGLHWNNKTPGRAEKTLEALEFIRILSNANIPRIALENPTGRISTAIRRPDQELQPYFFGEDASKLTCLWLKNLPPLEPTKFINGTLYCCGHELDEELGKYGCPNCCGDNVAKRRWGNQTPRGADKANNNRSANDRWKIRSRTFQGIAEAMADQWGNLK